MALAEINSLLVNSVPTSLLKKDDGGDEWLKREKEKLISSGSLGLDWLLEGGFAPGINLIEGPEASGKTTIICHAIMDAARKGKAVFLVNTEEKSSAFLDYLTGKHDWLRDYIFVPRREEVTAETIGADCGAWIKQWSEDKSFTGGVIIIDSLSGINSEDKEIVELLEYLHKTGLTIIATNQLRMDFDNLEEEDLRGEIDSVPANGKLVRHVKLPIQFNVKVARRIQLPKRLTMPDFRVVEKVKGKEKLLPCRSMVPDGMVVSCRVNPGCKNEQIVFIPTIPAFEDHKVLIRTKQPDGNMLRSMPVAEIRLMAEV